MLDQLYTEATSLVAMAPMYELVPDSDSQILEESRSFIEPVNYSKKKQSTSRFIKPAIAFLSISVVITLVILLSQQKSLNEIPSEFHD